MLETYKTILEGGCGEITEKKSRFIATVRPVKTEEEALAFLEEMKKNTGMQGITALCIRWDQTGNIPDAATTGSPLERQDVLCWM